jgi:hypothetical protein
MLEVIELHVRRCGGRGNRHVIVSVMEGMVVRAKRYELRGIVHEREWLPVEGIRTSER